MSSTPTPAPSSPYPITFEEYQFLLGSVRELRDRYVRELDMKVTEHQQLLTTLGAQTRSLDDAMRYTATLVQNLQSEVNSLHTADDTTMSYINDKVAGLRNSIGNLASVNSAQNVELSAIRRRLNEANI